MTSLTKEQMDVILTVMSAEEFDEYQYLLEDRLYHSTLTKEEEDRIKLLSDRLTTQIKLVKNME